MADNEKIELGALWKKRSERTGNEYFTGDIKTPTGDVIKVIAFTNDRKTKDNHPDIRIYLQEERQGQGGGNYAPRSNNYQQNSGGYQKPASTYSRPAPAPTPAAAPIEYPTEEIDPDDIPF